MNAEHHFGQTDLRARVARSNAITARERHFRAAAHAETVDRSDGRAAQARQVLEHALTVFDVGQDRTLFFVRLEFADVRAGDETFVFAGMDHNTFRWFDR